jgi:hypothetical protein
MKSINCRGISFDVIHADCGMGCQIHYVMTCLMIAHDMNRTLWMNWDKWPYVETSWTDIFLPIGITDCLIDNDTATVLWTRLGVDISYPGMITNYIIDDDDEHFDN